VTLKIKLNAKWLKTGFYFSGSSSGEAICSFPRALCAEATTLKEIGYWIFVLNPHF
jgi:hypothetical protein